MASSKISTQASTQGAASQAAKKAASKQVGLLGLTALVISAMVGGGIYSLPQSMATNASAAGQIIAWIITGVGMWFIANTFRILSEVRPDLKNGIYTYAERGFGKFVGFLIAFGYWICNCLALVAYGVLIMSTLDFFIPGVFGAGNTIWAIIGASVITWIIFLLACRGVKSGALLNLVGTIGKIIPVLIFIIALITVFQFSVFMDGFWGYTKAGVPLTFNLSSVTSQAMGTMMVTLFLFTGIEGAVVVSANAKSQKAVSKATTIGFFVVLLLYAAVSILPLGAYASTEIAGMTNPSLSTIMQDKFGVVGATIMNLGVIISVLSSWLVWVIMLAEMPYYAAQDNIFPKHFAKTNKADAPSYSLLWSTIIIQAALIISHFLTGNAWDVIIDISAVLCMPCYMMCAAFLWKIALQDPWPKTTRFSRRGALITGVLGTFFSIFLLYCSGVEYCLLSAGLIALGIPLFIVGQRQSEQWQGIKHLFTRAELIIFICLIIAGITGFIIAGISNLLTL